MKYEEWGRVERSRRVSETVSFSVDSSPAPVSVASDMRAVYGHSGRTAARKAGMGIRNEAVSRERQVLSMAVPHAIARCGWHSRRCRCCLSGCSQDRCTAGFARQEKNTIASPKPIHAPGRYISIQNAICLCPVPDIRCWPIWIRHKHPYATP